MNHSNRGLLQRAHAIAVLVKLRLIEQHAQWQLRTIPGLVLTPLLPPLTSAWVVTIDGSPLGRLYRTRHRLLSQQWIAVAYGPRNAQRSIHPTRSMAVFALLHKHTRRLGHPSLSTAIIQERSQTDD